MILHAIKLVKDAIEYINPGQTPLIEMDQPLYALAKQIQWERPRAYGAEQLRGDDGRIAY